jgi:hypothetical protein
MITIVGMRRKAYVVVHLGFKPLLFAWTAEDMKGRNWSVRIGACLFTTTAHHALKQDHPRATFTRLVAARDEPGVSHPIFHRVFCFRNEVIINWHNLVDSLLEQILL